jgi:aryl-alcohol dehydrogenase-like predicted oxidoreductase
VRLALGTVQFGLNYGVANASGQVSFEEVVRILDRAAAAGIDTLDTAIGYGDSEERLGRAGVAAWKVVTKLPGLPESCASIDDWVSSEAEGSLARLGVKQLYGVLLHRPADLLGPQGEKLYRALRRLIEEGRTRKVGISVYAPAELDQLLGRFEVGLVQAPYNVLDRRIEVSGWLDRLKAKGIEVHTRSTFLQGLLLQGPTARAEKFRRWDALWEAWDAWLAESGLTAPAAALGFVYRNPAVDRVLVGVDSERQLRDLLQVVDRPVPELPQAIATQDENLINPSRWNAL